jgi:hypothetical protein
MMSGMARPRAAWVMALGLLGVGWVVAHVLSYVLVAPAAQHAEMLAASGHGYFRAADLLILSMTIALAGLALHVVGGATHRAPGPWMLALLPPIGFVVQEHVERLAVSGAFPAHLVAEPRFLLGLALQVPFALAALLCARLLLVSAHRFASVRAARPAHARVLERLSPVLRPSAALPRRSVLAAGYSERGPPFSRSS